MNKQIQKFESKAKALAEINLLITQRPSQKEWKAGKELILTRYFPNASTNFIEDFNALAEHMESLYFCDMALTESLRTYKDEYEEVNARIRKYKKNNEILKGGNK